MKGSAGKHQLEDEPRVWNLEISGLTAGRTSRRCGDKNSKWAVGRQPGALAWEEISGSLREDGLRGLGTRCDQIGVD